MPILSRRHEFANPCLHSETSATLALQEADNLPKILDELLKDQAKLAGLVARLKDMEQSAEVKQRGPYLV